MQKDQIVVTYSNQQKWELQGLMSYINKLPDAKFSLSKNVGEQLKQDILSYFREAKRQLEDKNSSLQWVKDFLVEKHCFEKQTATYTEPVTKDIIYESIKRLRTYVSEKERDSQCYKIYGCLISELEEIRLQKVGQFQQKINKSYKVMSFTQRDHIAKVARRLAIARDLQAKVKSLEQVMLIADKIIRYGFSQQFKELQRMQDQQTKNKVATLLYHLQYNYLEIDSIYNRQNSLKQFIAKLSNNIYSQPEIIKKAKSIHPKAQIMFQPLVSEIFTLRSTSDAANLSHRYSEGAFHKKRANNSNDQDLKQLFADFGALRKKKEQLEAELNDMRWILTAISKQDEQVRMKDVSQITEYLNKYHLEQLSDYLQRMKEREKQAQSLKGEAYIEAQRRSQVDERQSTKLQELMQEINRCKQENEALNYKNYETVQQRIQMLNRIGALEAQIISKTTLHSSTIQQLQHRIDLYEKTIDSLKGKFQNLTQSSQTTHKYKQQLASQLAEALSTIERLQTQNSLYEKTISDLQKERPSENSQDVIDQTQKTSQTQIFDRLMDEKVQFYQRRIGQKDGEVSLLKQQKEELLKICKQLEVELLKVKEVKDLEIKALRYQLEQNQNKQLNDFTNELSQQILQLAARNQQLAHEIQSLIEAKESAQALTQSIHAIKQQSEQQNNKLKQSLGHLTKVQGNLRGQNDQLQKELQEIKTQIIALVDKHQIALQKIQTLQKKQQQLKDENIKLRRQINELKDSSLRQSEETSAISHEDYINLQSSFLELSKFNQLIKAEYLNYKSEVGNLIKAKVQEQTQKYIEGEKKLKESYKKLHEYFLIQREKLYSLKKENQSIKSSRSSLDSLQSSHQGQLKAGLDAQIKFRQLKIKYEYLQVEHERERQQKQAQLAQKQLLILRLQQQLQVPQINSVYQLVPLKERIKWLQIQLQEQQNTITFLKVQIEKKQQQIARLTNHTLRNQYR